MLTACGGGSNNNTSTPDNIVPILILLGNNPMNVIQDSTYIEPGATASDKIEKNIPVTISGTVDVHTIGTYTITYTAKNRAGKETTRTRTVNVISSTGFNGFPPAYYPNKTHPRLWLTQERLNSINLEKSNNTQRWQDFKQMCDAIIDSDNNNNPYGLDISPQNFTAPLALMYNITNDNKYADKAMELMNKTDTNLSKYGDPDHQNFYYLGLTYDWLYHYPAMSNSKKIAYRNKMRTLSDNFYNQINLTASGTDSDQYLLTGNLHLTFGAALYGDDNSSAKVMLDRAWIGWEKGYYQGNKGISNREIIKAGLGGVYFTGMAYLPSTDIIGIAGYTETLKTACNYDINSLEPSLKPFWKNLIQGWIYLTDPSKTIISDYGSWQDPNTLSKQPWMRRALTLAAYFAKEAGNEEASKLAKGYNDSVDVGDYNDYFMELFFNLPNNESHSPYDVNYQLPLIHFAKSPDFLLFRNNWNSDAIWGMFRGDGSVPLDQQASDHGSFSIWYKEGYLTKGARNYESLSNGDFFNTLSIQNNCTNNGNPCSGTAIFDSQKSAEISRDREGNSTTMFAYSMLEADGQWNDSNDSYNPVQNIQSYRRHFLWTPKYIILYDRVRNKVPLNIRYRLRAEVEPTISGNTITQTTPQGNYNLLHKTLEPTNVKIQKIDEKILWSGIADWIIDNSQRNWQSYIDFNSKKELNILNVMQMGSDTMSHFDTLEYINDTSSSGVRIGNLVSIFNKKEKLRNHVTYTVNNIKNKMVHFITDLTAGSYSVKLNSTLIGNYKVKNHDNSLLFETNISSVGDNLFEITQKN